ncbi:SDR family NAD(P)-dependent oxidoreductase [Allosaccharopolyspora coralli]|uniref:SDR family NAD(P)-dependent oxidoreductase n=1 Tax=Allosaccharopolyspora coralli TaxID=2665642 RepID=A0A5Q3Q712_9PSEU|nr:SDR family NAD(P)-dependent oxidoreductase [Allosaccharopolyspora coralli]QGK70451.1 SDR family NAD(P)-dependent oxidoreductase [Allosaccharopolyspora coralli]
MELQGKNVLVAGATGVLGSRVSRALRDEGARVALAGRNRHDLDALSGEFPDSPTIEFEAIDTDSCTRCVETAVRELGERLDVLVVTLGVAAFGPARETDSAVVEHLLAVNTLAPIALTTAALPHVRRAEGTVAVLSAILADHPTPDMAASSSSKAAVSAWLTALRREERSSGVSVFDIRPPHMDTGLADRAIAGTASRLPTPTDIDLVVGQILSGLRDGARELSFDVRAGEFSLR